MKSIFYRTAVVLAAVAILAACKPADKLQVTPVNALPDGEFSERIIYTLPRTVIKVSVEAEHELSVPGPYKDFAVKFLGITGVIEERSENWKVRSVQLSTSQEYDPEKVYAINILSGSFDPQAFINLTENGLVMDANKATESFFAPTPLQTGISAGPDFTDLSIQHNFEVKEETMYKTIVTDTGYVRVPLLRTQIEQKTLEKKAEEAAAFITKLRKRRFKLISGQYEVFPEGIALAEAVKKMDQTENEYLSLFIGKKYTETNTREYWFIPSSSGAGEEQVLTAFSASAGFEATGGEDSQDLVLRVEPENAMKAVGDLLPAYDETFNQLYYRIPGMVRIQLLQGGKVLAECRCSIAQSGTMVTIPVK